MRLGAEDQGPEQRGPGGARLLAPRPGRVTCSPLILPLSPAPAPSLLALHCACPHARQHHSPASLRPRQGAHEDMDASASLGWVRLAGPQGRQLRPSRTLTPTQHRVLLHHPGHVGVGGHTEVAAALGWVWAKMSDQASPPNPQISGVQPGPPESAFGSGR